MAVPFNLKTTDDADLNKVQTEIAHSFSLVPDALGASVLATDASVTVDKETSIVVLPTAVSSITVTLPGPTEKQVVILNRSKYAVKISSSDAKFVFADLVAGGNATVMGTTDAWFCTTSEAK